MRIKETIIKGEMSQVMFNHILPTSTIREGTFFLGGGEGWGILVFFSQKSVGPPLHFNKKNS